MNFNTYQSQGVTSIHNVFFEHLHLFRLSDGETLLVFHLLNLQEQPLDLEDLARRLNRETAEIRQLLNGLYKKEIVSVSDLGEVNLNPLYVKIDQLFENEKEDKLDLNQLRKTFEESFGRLLGSFELEKLREWATEESFDLEVIQLALQEAALKNAKNLKYIEAILQNWKSKGLETREAVIQDQKDWRRLKGMEGV